MKKSKLRNKIITAFALTGVMSVIYYFAYSFVELNLSKWCKTNICIEFPSYADALAIWVAIIGLYFIVTSLEEWKGQYKFEKALQTFKKVKELSYGLDKLLGDTWVLINESRRIGCSHAYENYQEKLKSDNLGVKIYLLRLDVFEERNHYKQECFERIIDLINSFESNFTGELRDLHWNDSSQIIKNTADAEIIFDKYREQLKPLRKTVEELKEELYMD